MQIKQVARAQQAATMLQQGSTILDTVYTLGYFDQPHLTRSLKQWIGYTPAQIAQGSAASGNMEIDAMTTPMELTA
jgi:AraC-like DNA-binding protein